MDNPFRAVHAGGQGVTRGVTIAVPTAIARNLLPVGLEPGPQNVTPKGTHPVILFFHDFHRAGFSIPTPFPSQSYREFTVGVPFSYLSRESITPGYPGPYHFMPRLFLDNISATLTGVLAWGMPKELAAFRLTVDRYSISNLAGEGITTLSWKSDNPGQPGSVGEWPYFRPIRAILDQPLIMRYPVGYGPFFVVADFNRYWNKATIRPIQTVVDVEYEYVPGFPAGRYPAAGWSQGINESVLGSYELTAPWSLSLPYPPIFSFR